MKGAGYVVIYTSVSRSRFRKYELSARKTTLRYTSVKDGERREMLYERVTNPDEIRTVEYKSEFWTPHNIEDTDDYIIMKQRTANGNKSTGYIKVVRQDRAEVYKGLNGIFNGKPGGMFIPVVEADASDWMYFKKRRNNN